MIYPKLAKKAFSFIEMRIVIMLCVMTVSCSSTNYSEKKSGQLLSSTTPSVSPVRTVVYSSHTNRKGLLFNLGPTGARAWMRGYHFVIIRIDQGSPAHNCLNLADVVLGINGVMFGPGVDPRVTLGNAIEQAEGSGDPILFNLLRKGERKDVALPLQRLGTFAATWPYNCRKSDIILEKGCRSLALAQMPNGEIPTDTNLGTLFAGLLFTAANDPLYLDAARRAAHHTARPDTKVPTNNWQLGYSGVMLAEYYLLSHH